MPPSLNITKIYSKISPVFAYLDKQKENQKFIKMVEVGATFVLISFFTFFAIKPTVLTISALLGDINSKQLLTKDLKGKINNVIVAQDLFSQIQEKYYLIESSLPNSPRFSQALNQIDGAASVQQLEIEKLNFAIDNRFFTTSVSTNSSYLSAISLVSELSKNRRLMEFGDINISVDKDVKDQKVNFIIPLNIYYWPIDAKK